MNCYNYQDQYPDAFLESRWHLEGWSLREFEK